MEHFHGFITFNKTTLEISRILKIVKCAILSAFTDYSEERKLFLQKKLLS